MLKFNYKNENIKPLDMYLDEYSLRVRKTFLYMSSELKTTHKCPLGLSTSETSSNSIRKTNDNLERVERDLKNKVTTFKFIGKR